MTKKCQRCAVCCTYPGIMLPEDVENISSSLNITNKQLFNRYLILTLIKKTTCDNSFVYALMPAKKGKKNKLLTKDYNTIYDRCWPWKKQCVFLKNKLCTIHKTKPYGCKTLICKKMGKETTQDHLRILKTWEKNQNIIFSILPELKYTKTLKQLSKIKGIKQKEICLWSG